MTERVIAFQRGNEVVWREIVQNNSDWLYALSVRLLWDSNDAQEAVQDCFLQAFKKRGQLKSFDRLCGWLRTICIRICLRKRSKNKTVSLHEVEEFLVPTDQLSPDGMVTTREEIEKVLRGLVKLPPRQRSCLMLSVFERLSMKEIAETMGIKNGTVRHYIFEARQFLYQYLKIDRKTDEK
jgi:RNA polymerase sigma-70 factor (ECF subfamily)